MLSNQTILSGNLSQSRRGHSLMTGLVLSIVLLISQLSYGHSSTPSLIRIQVDETATWTVTPGGERDFKTAWQKPTMRSTGCFTRLD